MSEVLRILARGLDVNTRKSATLPACACACAYKHIRIQLTNSATCQPHEFCIARLPKALKIRSNLADSIAVQIYFAANDDATVRYVSRLLGTKKIQTTSRSEPGGFGWATKTTGHAARDLMLPEEVRQLKHTQAIVFKEGARPVLGKKIRYFRDRASKRCVLPPAPVPKLDLSPPKDLNIAVHASVSNIDENSDAVLPSQDPELAAQAEIAAMGHRIAELMSAEMGSDASEARAELLAALGEEADR